MTQHINQDCLAPEALQQLLATDGNSAVLIDVRSREEYAEGHIKEAINIPVDSLLDHLDEIDRTKNIVTICWKGGGRSAKASEILKEQGYKNVQYLCNGTAGWLAHNTKI